MSSSYQIKSWNVILALIYICLTCSLTACSCFTNSSSPLVQRLASSRASLRRAMTWTQFSVKIPYIFLKTITRFSSFASRSDCSLASSIARRRTLISAFTAFSLSLEIRIYTHINFTFKKYIKKYLNNLRENEKNTKSEQLHLNRKKHVQKHNVPFCEYIFYKTRTI